MEGQPIPARWCETVLVDPDSGVAMIPCQTRDGDTVALLLDSEETAGLTALLLLAGDS